MRFEFLKAGADFFMITGLDKIEKFINGDVGGVTILLETFASARWLHNRS